VRLGQALGGGRMRRVAVVDRRALARALAILS
jgi:hypothetical protein